MIPLQKYIAECGIASRRESERLIVAGQVGINGQKAKLGDAVDPVVDVVTCGDEPIKPKHKIYLALNKPRGVISSVKAAGDGKSVMDYLAGVKARVYPVGRLDKDTEGLVILTNDGDLAHRLTQPECLVEKAYLTWVQGQMSPETAARLEQGIALADGSTAYAKVHILHTGMQATLIHVALCDTKRSKVKRLCTEAGHPVCELRRVAFGNIQVHGVKPGAWRYLTDAEAEGLRRLTDS